MSPYGQPPAYGAPPRSSALTVTVGVPFLLQALLGFFGALAYGFVLLVVMVAAINLPQALFSLLLLGGLGLGLATTLFLTFYLRWYGFLAGVALAFLAPVLLFGACMAFIIGVNVFGGMGF